MCAFHQSPGHSTHHGILKGQQQVEEDGDERADTKACVGSKLVARLWRVQAAPTLPGRQLPFHPYTKGSSHGEAKTPQGNGNNELASMKLLTSHRRTGGGSPVSRMVMTALRRPWTVSLQPVHGHSALFALQPSNLGGGSRGGREGLKGAQHAGKASRRDGAQIPAQAVGCSGAWPEIGCGRCAGRRAGQPRDAT